jgi:hypothetical protein
MKLYNTTLYGKHSSPYVKRFLPQQTENMAKLRKIGSQWKKGKHQSAQLKLHSLVLEWCVSWGLR